MKSIKQLMIMSISLILAGCQFQSGVENFPTSAVDIPVEPAILVVDGRLVPEKTVHLNSRNIAQVDEILVEEDEIVNKGDPLLRLDGWQQLQVIVSSAELALLQAEQDLDDLNRTADLSRLETEISLLNAQQELLDAEELYEELDTDEYQQDIDDAKVDVNQAEDELEDARDELDEYRDLDENNQLRVNAEDEVKDAEIALAEAKRIRDRLIFDRDLAWSNLENARKEVEELRYQYSQKQNGPDDGALSLAEAALKKAEDDLVAAQYQLENLIITAPFSGKVMKLHIEEGDSVMVNQLLVTFADDSQYFVETTDLTEMDIFNIEVGDNVLLEPDAIPDMELEGKVVEISPWYYEKGGDVQYQVRIVLSKMDPRLKWGMTFAVRFP